jgi:endonuclease YncB( thermonuclease family)
MCITAVSQHGTHFISLCMVGILILLSVDAMMIDNVPMNTMQLIKVNANDRIFRCSTSFSSLVSPISCVPSSRAALDSLITPRSATMPTTIMTLEDNEYPTLTSNSIHNNAMEFDDLVVRVVDGNTIKLQRRGLVSLAAIQTPSSSYSGAFPDCMTYTPASKLKQLLPPDTKVHLILLPSSNELNTKDKQHGVLRPKVLLFLPPNKDEKDNKFVNLELVRVGMAKPSPRGLREAEMIVPGLTTELERMNEQAKIQNIGMYQTCQTNKGSYSQDTFHDEFNDELQFEPIPQQSMQTQYTYNPYLDTNSHPTPPKNPGDTKQCSDFTTYEDALSWFEYYQPYYGDVAKLDRNMDGIPCSGLPHIKNSERYRMKVSSTNKPSSIIHP